MPERHTLELTGRAASATARPRPARGRPSDRHAPVRIGGLPITAATLAEAADHMVEAALAARGRPGRPLYVTSANGQVIALCHQDRAVRDLFLAADVIHADGQPMVFASKILCARPLPERVATTDLVHDVMRRSGVAGLRHFLLGARPEVNARAVEQLRRAYPDVPEIAGHHGYFRPAEEDAVLGEIERFAPDVLWVALGVPLEQRFVMRNRDRLASVGVIKTSGGLFDFLSHAKSRAPRFVQDVGLEWAWRLAQEPRRLGWRYLTTNPLAAWLLLSRSGD